MALRPLTVHGHDSKCNITIGHYMWKHEAVPTLLHVETIEFINDFESILLFLFLSNFSCFNMLMG